MSAIIVVDAFWGDSGKGKVAAFLAERTQAQYCVRAGTGTNAGHSVFFADGREIRTHQLPCGVLRPATRLRVGSGVAVDPECLFDELERLDRDFAVRGRTMVDGRCPVIEPRHRDLERSDANLQGRVGTVGSGSGAARADFVLRRARQARDVEALAPYVTDVARELNDACAAGQTIVIEGSQGTHLSLALSDDYPCCTSDNCTTAALADDVGLSWRHIGEVVLVVKALPSRVGAGPLPLALEPAEEDARGIAEYGVTTGRRRRKAAGISWPHLDTAVMLNGPTQIALTFCDHLDAAVAGARSARDLTRPVAALVDQLQERYGLPVTLCDCGKLYEDLLQLS